MYKTREELLASIGIEEVELSSKACEILKKKQIATLSQMMKLEKSDFDSDVSSEIIEEIIQTSFEIDLKPTYTLDKSFELPYEYKKIATDACEHIGIDLDKAIEYVSTSYYDNSNCDCENIIQELYSHKYPRTKLKEKLFNICLTSGGNCSIEDIKRNLPIYFLDFTNLHKILEELVYENKVTYIDNVYNVVLPTVYDYISQLSNERAKDIITKKLDGVSFEETAKEYNMTRQGISLICHNAFTNGDLFMEDRYKYLYQEYNLSLKLFCLITGASASVYRYLEIVYISNQKSKKNPKDISNDVKLSTEIREKAEKEILHRTDTLVDNKWIKSKAELVHYIFLNFFKHKTTANEVLYFCNNYIHEHNLDKSFMLTRKYLKYILEKSSYTLYGMHSSVRYYDILSRDYSDLLNKLSLEQYKDIEISTLKLFRENKDLMNKYDIQDEYELHNLLKKIWPKENQLDIVFSKMPTIHIGKANRDKQILDMLIQNSPISKPELQKKYEEKYGYTRDSTYISFRCIDKYLHDGIYKFVD